MTFQTTSHHAKHRWLALLAIVVLGTGLTASTALASPTFTFTPDDRGANDEPGQKDLTAQATAFDGPTFYSAWKWDDTSWNGKNTGDACSLFDTDGDGFVNYAVCVTVATKDATEQSTRVYSCGDTKADRCTSTITLLGTEGATNWCTVSNSAPGQFSGDTSDTLAVCNISQISSDLSIASLVGANLLNSCSYPSQQPNSDPSDCVLTPTAQNTSVTTLSSGTVSWSATLNDTATLNPPTATGNVVFQLWSDAACTTLVWTSPSIAVTAGGTATTNGGGTPNNGNTVSTAGTYYWTSAFTPTGLFNASSSSCGEATVVVAPSVTGSAG